MGRRWLLGMLVCASCSTRAVDGAGAPPASTSATRMVEACRAVRTQVSNAERMRALAASIAAYETAIARAVRSLAIVHRHTLGVLQLADREPQLVSSLTRSDR